MEQEAANSPELKTKAAGPWWYHFSCLPATDKYPCGEGSGCYSPGYSCITDVPVGPLADGSMEKARDSLIDLIDHGEVSDFFQNPDYYSNLFPNLYDDHPGTADSLASGLKDLYYARSAELYMFIWEPLEE